MTIMITGGAGYIGSHTARLLSERGYDIVIYDNLSTGHKKAVEGLPFVHGDINDTNLFSKTINDFHITDVIHFAASSTVGESMKDPQQYYLNNVVGTLSLLDTLLACKVERIVFSSSAAVYGEPEHMPITEDYALRPTSVYGRTKQIIEGVLEDYSRAYGLKYVSLRYFNACGADDSGKIGEDHEQETHLIPLVLKTSLGQRDKVYIFGDDYPTEDGTCIRDYVHVKDLAQAHLLSSDYLIDKNESIKINLGNGNGFSVKEIIKTAENVAGKVIPAEVAPRRSGDPVVLVADSQKAEALLGWKPQYRELREMIETAWNWHKNNPEGYK